MVQLTKECEYILPGFIMVFAAWLICSLSMVLTDWRVWEMQDPQHPEFREVTIGLWRVCKHYFDSYGRYGEDCRAYGEFIPFEVFLSQKAMIVANVMGILSMISTIFILAKRHMQMERITARSTPYVGPGKMNIFASLCVFVAILTTTGTVNNMEGLDLPPSFDLPPIPDSKHIGISVVFAGISCFLYFITRSIFFFGPGPEEVWEEPEE